jgi:hypothetical protein
VENQPSRASLFENPSIGLAVRSLTESPGCDFWQNVALSWRHSGAFEYVSLCSETRGLSGLGCTGRAEA